MAASLGDPLFAQIMFWGRIFVIVLWGAYIAHGLIRRRRTGRIGRYDKVLLVVGSGIVAINIVHLLLFP